MFNLINNQRNTNQNTEALFLDSLISKKIFNDKLLASILRNKWNSDH